MRIWVTGAAGFLGARLVRALETEHEVVGIARQDVDLAHPEAVQALRLLPSPEVVVHTAARQPKGVVDASAYVESNVLTTARLLDALADLAPRRFVFTSTLSVYGRPVRNPVSPTDGPEPTHQYGVTKRAAEQLVEYASIPERVVLRLPSLYGAGQEDSFVDGLARGVLAGRPIEVFAGGRTLRDALHVDDAVEACVRAVEAPLPEGCLYLHVGVGRAVTTGEWASALVEAFGSESEVVPVERPSTQASDLYADVSAARVRLGFEPRDLGVAMRSYADELRAAH